MVDVPGRPDRDALEAQDVLGLAADLDGPVRLPSFGPMCAMSCEYTGASRHRTTRTRNTTPKNSETLLRRSRRQARRYGPIPAGAPASAVLSRRAGGRLISHFRLQTWRKSRDRDRLTACPVPCGHCGPTGTRSLVGRDSQQVPTVDVVGVLHRDVLRGEERERLVAEHSGVRLLGDVLLELLPAPRQPC